jgi:hypothetical protein
MTEDKNLFTRCAALDRSALAAMPEHAFRSLRVREAPADWRRFLATTTTHER